MTKSRDRKPPPAEASWAYFLDVDGTLIDIAETPDAVLVDEHESAVEHVEVPVLQEDERDALLELDGPWRRQHLKPSEAA